MMDDSEEFERESLAEIKRQGNDTELKEKSLDWIKKANMSKYSYHFKWLGRPIIQYPQDIVALQEIIFKIKPDLIIETGVARGGTLVLSSSMLELNALCGGPADAKVIGIDIDLREHNKNAIDSHPLSKRIRTLKGSSIDPRVVEEIRSYAKNKKSILVYLDSNHTHEHVARELEVYSPLVTKGSYCIVFDTIIEDLPKDTHPNRPWNVGNNPKTAVIEFLKNNPEFKIDTEIDNKLLVSVAPQGFLQKVC